MSVTADVGCRYGRESIDAGAHGIERCRYIAKGGIERDGRFSDRIERVSGTKNFSQFTARDEFAAKKACFTAAELELMRGIHAVQRRGEMAGALHARSFAGIDGGCTHVDEGSSR